MSEITFKGVTSTIKNVKVLKYPDIHKPVLRVETVTIPGRHGDVTLAGAPTYEARVLEAECMVADASDISEAAAWLSGSGDLILGNDPTYAYDAKVVEEIRFEKIMRGHDHRRFTVPFLCQPLKRLTETEADIVLTASGGFVVNPGHVISRPLIKIEGSGTVRLMIGLDSITMVEGLNDEILIDSDLGIATDTLRVTNMTALVSGDWPVIEPGKTPVSWTGNITKLTITPRWRWL